MWSFNGLAKVFVIFGSHLLCKFIESLAEECEKIDDCSCRKSNGKVINLREIDGGSTGPSFKGIPTINPPGSSNAFNWNPCTKFTEGGGCQNVLVCQYNTESVSQSTYPCADTVSKFQVNSDGSTSIIYKPYTSDVQRFFTITLFCEAEEYPGKTSGVTEKHAQKPHYEMTFKSKCACDDGCPVPPQSESNKRLSTGSILLIVFFTLLLLYLVGGIVIKRYKMGVQTMPEMIPNYELWAQIPSLIKDGTMFACQSLKSGCSAFYQKCKKSDYASI
ncbi:uncharacterized protein [Montipora foliosa]|uniref:uncharacterized protein n=1 Tax=Montipora foliosa TaxID=591990 RepID=UPI0035F1F244